ncbi:MAG: hypothetical protein V4857_28090 [Pseudomonadota bacterium]
MHIFFRCTSAALIVSMLSGCMGMQVLADGPRDSALLASNTGAGLKAGMTLSLTLKNGQRQPLLLSKVEPTALVGTSNGQAVRVDIEQITRIEQREVSSGKTTALVIGIGLGLAVLVAAARGAAAGQIMDGASN